MVVLVSDVDVLNFGGTAEYPSPAPPYACTVMVGPGVVVPAGVMSLVVVLDTMAVGVGVGLGLLLVMGVTVICEDAYDFDLARPGERELCFELLDLDLPDFLELDFDLFFDRNL